MAFKLQNSVIDLDLDLSESGIKELTEEENS